MAKHKQSAQEQYLESILQNPLIKEVLKTPEFQFLGAKDWIIKTAKEKPELPYSSFDIESKVEIEYASKYLGEIYAWLEKQAPQGMAPFFKDDILMEAKHRGDFGKAKSYLSDFTNAMDNYSVLTILESDKRHFGDVYNAINDYCKSPDLESEDEQKVYSVVSAFYKELEKIATVHTDAKKLQTIDEEVK